MSDLFEKFNNVAGQNNISPDMVNNLFNMLKNSNNSHNNNSDTNFENTSNDQYSNNFSNSSSASSNSNGIDIETIMKMKSIIDKMNVKDDPRSNLLQSLKPYLKDSRRAKVDQYIQLMNMSKVMEIFPFMGGDNKK